MYMYLCISGVHARRHDEGLEVAAPVHAGWCDLQRVDRARRRGRGGGDEVVVGLPQGARGRPALYLSIYDLSIHPSIELYMYMYIGGPGRPRSIHPSIYLSTIYLSIHPSI